MSQLENIKGIGPKTLPLLNRLNIYTLEDMVHFYPYRFDVIERSNLRDANEGDKVIVDGIVQKEPLVYFFSKKMNKMTFQIDTRKIIKCYDI